MKLAGTRLGVGMIGLAALLLAAAPAMAQISGAPPLHVAGDALVLEAAGQSLTLPMPDWLADTPPSDAVLSQLQTRYVTDDFGAMLEIYPNDQAMALWTELYGARLVYGDGALADYRQLVIDRSAAVCRPALTVFFQLGADQGDTLAPFGFVCGAYADRLAGYADEGEVMVMSFRKTASGIAMVYQRWRGPAFDPSKPQSWPVTPQQVQARARQIQAEARLALLD